MNFVNLFEQSPHNEGVPVTTESFPVLRAPKRIAGHWRFDVGIFHHRRVWRCGHVTANRIPSNREMFKLRQVRLIPLEHFGDHRLDLGQ